MLIVEDELLIAEDIRAALEGAGYAVIGVADCMGEAIALARQHRPDLTLMDVQLKGGDSGIETAKYLREHFQTAVVFLTAFSDQALLRQAQQAVDTFGQECLQARLALTTGYWGQGAHARTAEFAFAAAGAKPFTLGDLTRAVQAALGAGIGAEGKP